MQYFAVHYTYVDDAGLIARHRPDHRAFPSGLTDKGLIAGGTYPDTTPLPTLLVLEAESAEAVSKLLTGDPLRNSGVLTDVCIVCWALVVGIFAE